MLFITPLENWGITKIPTISSRTWFFKIVLKSSFKSRTASRRTLNRKLYFAATVLTSARLFLFFPGLDTDWLQQKRPSLSCSSTYWKSPTSTTSERQTVVRGAASPTADDATVSAPNPRSRVTLTAFLRDTNFSRHDLRSAITGGASLYSNRTLRVKFRTVSNSIRGSNGSVQPADRSLREKVPLCDKRMKHKNLHTCYCPLRFLMVDSNPIERHSKDRMHLRGTPHH